jgi:hypothetical protein
MNFLPGNGSEPNDISVVTRAALNQIRKPVSLPLMPPFAAPFLCNWFYFRQIWRKRVGVEANTGRHSRIGVIDCPQTGRGSGKCQRMRHFSIADLAPKNHKFCGRLETVSCAVPLLSWRACGPRNLMKVVSVTALFSAPRSRLSTLSCLWRTESV